MKYTCELCSYITSRKNDFTKHCNSKKHKLLTKKVNIDHIINKPQHTDDTPQHINSQFVCDSCKLSFSRKDSLSRHKKTCIALKQNENKLKDKLKQTENKLEQLKKELDKEKDQSEYYKELLMETVKGGTGTNIVIMVNNHFGNANKLLPPKNDELRIFGLDHPKKASYTFKNDMIEQANNLLLDSKEADEDKFYYDKLTEVYGRGRDKRNDNINRGKCKIVLANFIATGIRVLYKTKNPEEQAFWSTDVSRYNFIIKDDKWRNDKSGEKLKETLVTTILDDINVRMKRQIQRETKKSLDYSEENKLKLSTLDYRQIIRDIPRAGYIIDDIETGVLGDLIIKKTAKYFKVDKELLFDLEHLNKKKSIAKKVKTSKKGLRKIKKVIKVEEDEE